MLRKPAAGVVGQGTSAPSRAAKACVLVIKLGGEIADDPARLRSFCEEVLICHRSGARVLLVHGGGKQASALQLRLGIVPRLINGRRITDPESLEVVKMTFAGSLNTDIVRQLRELGLRPVGLTGVDAGLIRARRRPPQRQVDRLTGCEELVDFGHVGDIVGVDQSVLTVLLDGGFIPVVACLGVDDRDCVCNLNADSLAAAIATQMKADRLVFASDVDGVRDAAGQRVPDLTPEEGRALLHSNAVTGGMIPKLQSAIDAAGSGVRIVHIVNGLKPGSILDALSFEVDAGTVMRAREPVATVL